MPQFIYLYRISEEAQSWAMNTPGHVEQSLQKWMNWIRELEAGGHLVSPGQPLAATGKTMRGRDKVISDGPFIEVKDLVAGFSLVEAADVEEATALAAGCPILDGDGSVEVRPIRVVGM